jgi:hypothetical protein
MIVKEGNLKSAEVIPDSIASIPIMKQEDHPVYL